MIILHQNFIVPTNLKWTSNQSFHFSSWEIPYTSAGAEYVWDIFVVLRFANSGNCSSAHDTAEFLDYIRVHLWWSSWTSPLTSTTWRAHHWSPKYVSPFWNYNPFANTSIILLSKLHPTWNTTIIEKKSHFVSKTCTSNLHVKLFHSKSIPTLNKISNYLQCFFYFYFLIFIVISVLNGGWGILGHWSLLRHTLPIVTRIAGGLRTSNIA